MKLVTFQSMNALKQLINDGYLECDDTLINMKKVGHAYDFIVENMNKEIDNPFNTKYPLWAWVKFKNGICPKKHKGHPVKGFDVKITFNKDSKDVFITDYRRYSFILNNIYIPDNKKDKDKFDKLLKIYNITKEDLEAFVRKDKYESHRMDKEFLDICSKIKDSFHKCFTTNSDVLQGCIWRINLEEVESIELLNEKHYAYGTFNYIRKNGERFNWIEDFYKTLK